MILKNLVLENFQGIRNITLDFSNGYSASLYGDNATGKTTVFNSLTWLLFGKSSTDTTGFTPKTRDVNGDVHHLNHSATATFRAESGQDVTLKKIYREVYKKKHGAPTDEFSGHTTDHYIDGVPVTEKEYSATVLNLCGGDIEKPKILLMPDYFAKQMNWKNRRKILLEICGDVTDEDVIFSNPQLKDLPELLRMPGTSNRMYDVEDYRKIAQARRKDIKKKKEDIPARIDEANKAIPDVDGYCEDVITEEISAMIKLVSDLNAERVSILAGDSATSEIKKQIASLTVTLEEKKGEFIKKQNEVNAELDKQALIAKTEAIKHKQAYEEAKAKHSGAIINLDTMKEQRDKVLLEYKETKNEVFDIGNGICNACGQSLPKDKIAELKNKFEVVRQKKIDDILKRGSECSKEMIADLEKKISDLAITAEEEMKQYKEHSDAAEELVAMRLSKDLYEKSDDYKDIFNQIEFLRTKLLEENDVSQTKNVERVDSQISEATERLKGLQELKSRFIVLKAQERRIAELENEEKKLAKEYESTEKGLYLCDLFTKTKVSMLTERINKEFSRVGFRLFVEQINGGVDECCDVLVPADDGRMIPYQYANNAARINAGLDIINTLSTRWELKMPVIVDNAESVSRLAKVDTQVIRLVVSEPDKSIRVELDVLTSTHKSNQNII